MKLELDSISKSYGKFKALPERIRGAYGRCIWAAWPQRSRKTTLINILVGHTAVQRRNDPLGWQRHRKDGTRLL